jgi:DNA-binding transcriptional regulator YbjK
VLIEQYAGKKLSDQMYPAWRGGYYYAGRHKGDAAAPLGLMYASRWSSPEKASEFAQIYARSLERRYKKVEEVADSSPQSSIHDSEGKREVLNGRHAWTTEEGTVVIEEQGDTVLVTEGLDAATTQSLEKELFAAGK